MNESNIFIASTMNFNCIHKLIITNIVYFSFIGLNTFPVKNVISEKISPRVIVVRTNLDWGRQFKLVVGRYCKIHDEPYPSNTRTPRTHGE